jgi:hypothetical protein
VTDVNASGAGCPFAVPGRLQALAGGQLGGDEAAPLLAHLGVDCPHCQELWASDETAALLAAAADRVEAELPVPRPGELDAIYRRIEEKAGLSAAAATLAAASEGAGWRAALGRWLRPLALAAVPAVILLLVVLPRLGGGPSGGAGSGGSGAGAGGDTASSAPWRIKGDGVGLRLFRGRPATTAAAAPEVLGEVVGPLHAGEAVLFRLRLGRPGEVVLSVVEPGGQREELWRHTYPAGEHELQREGRALAYGVERAGTYRFELVQGDQKTAARVEVQE